MEKVEKTRSRSHLVFESRHSGESDIHVWITKFSSRISTSHQFEIRTISYFLKPIFTVKAIIPQGKSWGCRCPPLLEYTYTWAEFCVKYPAE